MRKGIALAASIAILACAWLVYSKVVQARRENAYRTAMAPFKRDLPIGMPRADVRKYLDARNMEYHAVRYGESEAETYEIKIGEEPGNLVCKSWTLYVAFEFSSGDALREIHIRKIGTCS